MHNIFILVLFFATVWTLPLSYETTMMAAEEDMYMSTIQHYQNRVDIVLSSKSEELLINLIHLPKQEREQVIEIQGNRLGIKVLSYPQRAKLPSIIAQHIHTMNNKIYDSVQTLIADRWWTLKKDEVAAKLMYLNGLLAQDLIEVIDSYDLLEKVKKDVLLCQSYSLSWQSVRQIRWFTVVPQDSPFELNFLSQYLSEIKAGLLLDFHSEFMSFLTRILDHSFDPLLEDSFES